MSDFTETNRAYWESEAATYNTKHHKTGTHLIASLQANLPFINAPFLASSPPPSPPASPTLSPSPPPPPPRTFRILDYACGPGAVSKALAQFASSTTGIDLSPAMVAAYNATAADQGLADDEMRAFVGDLLVEDEPRPEALEGERFWGFDLVVVGLGFHHFEDPVRAAGRLAERLKGGGVLVVVDFLPHGGPGHGHGHGHGNGHGGGHEHGHGPEGEKSEEQGAEDRVGATVRHHGFAEGEMRRIFEAAGVGREFGYMVLGKGVVIGPAERRMKREVFIARGTKA